MLRPTFRNENAEYGEARNASTSREAAARPLEQLLYWLLRVALGLYLVAAGTGKALDVPGYIAVIESFRLGLPAVLLWPSAIAIVVVELGLGFAILAGSVRAALGSAVLHGLYFALLASALWRGLDVPNCGCFGVFFARPLGWDSFVEDLVLIALSLALVRLGQRHATRKQAARATP